MIFASGITSRRRRFARVAGSKQWKDDEQL